MERDRAADCSGAKGRASARGRCPEPGEWRHVCAEHGMSVAIHSQGFRPRSTVYRYFWDWSRDGTLDRIHDALYAKCREKLGPAASPSACIVDSRSVKSAEKGGCASIRTASMRAS